MREILPQLFESFMDVLHCLVEIAQLFARLALLLRELYRQLVFALVWILTPLLRFTFIWIVLPLFRILFTYGGN
jgi:hypothetical protein